MLEIDLVHQRDVSPCNGREGGEEARVPGSRESKIRKVSWEESVLDSPTRVRGSTARSMTRRKISPRFTKNLRVGKE